MITPELIKAINDGTLYGAAIDTYENEATLLDWTGKEIEDETLLELIKHENIFGHSTYRILL